PREKGGGAPPPPPGPRGGGPPRGRPPRAPPGGGGGGGPLGGASVRPVGGGWGSPPSSSPALLCCRPLLGGRFSSPCACGRAGSRPAGPTKRWSTRSDETEAALWAGIPFILKFESASPHLESVRFCHAVAAWSRTVPCTRARPAPVATSFGWHHSRRSTSRLLKPATVDVNPMSMELSMAKLIREIYIDDLDGTEMESENVVKFGLDGINYEIDLAEKNEEALRKAL